ncbi:MAG: tetratricopeptide repeat protein [Planctomycetes bacterium]|nr:tetratricopeptide repeat protein [Planctomycetota bacterium]
MRNRYWILAALVAAGCGSNGAEDLAEGDRLLVEGKREEALAVYQRVASEDGGTEAQIRVGRTQLLLGRLDEALAAFRQAVQKTPPEGRLDTVLDAYEILLEENRAAAALEWLDAEAPQAEPTTDRNETDTRVLLARGQAMLAMGKIDAAMEVFERARREKEDAQTLALVGAACYLAGLQELSRASGDPREAAEARDRARALLSRARDALQGAVYLDPKHFAAHFSLGQLYDQAGRLDEALLEYEWSRKLRPDRAEPWLLIGRIHYERREMEEAVAAFREAGRLGAGAQADFSLGMVLWAMERRPESVQAFGAALRARPELARQAAAWFEQDRERSLGQLIDLLEAGDPEVVAASLALLQGMSGESFGADARLWREWSKGGSETPSER